MNATASRVFVEIALDGLAAGMSPEEIMDHYPQLAVEDIRAAAAYAPRGTATE